jgi:hypothetical protein
VSKSASQAGCQVALLYFERWARPCTLHQRQHFNEQKPKQAETRTKQSEKVLETVLLADPLKRTPA